jgi:hypothetical protein
MSLPTPAIDNLRLAQHQRYRETSPVTVALAPRPDAPFAGLSAEASEPLADADVLHEGDADVLAPDRPRASVPYSLLAALRTAGHVRVVRTLQESGADPADGSNVGTADGKQFRNPTAIREPAGATPACALAFQSGSQESPIGGCRGFCSWAGARVRSARPGRSDAEPLVRPVSAPAPPSSPSARAIRGCSPSKGDCACYMPP